MKQGELVAGRYRILRAIGAGATGTVWAARHEVLDRDLALKIAAVGAGAGRDVRARFVREARIVARLRHPNIVDIADAGEVGGGEHLYLAMELLEGSSLAQWIAAHGPLAPAEALAVAAEVCRGLSAAHAAGVIHRDIKPENIFLARGSTGGFIPKLLDFGVSSARGLTTLRHGQLFGTPAYMSPEQALGEAVDHRSDVWSLGVVLYEMLTARHPFIADSYPALLPLIIEKPPPPLPASIPLEVRTVVAGCLAKDRADRYPSADALLDAIDRARSAVRSSDAGPSSAGSGFFVETGPHPMEAGRSPAFASPGPPEVAAAGRASRRGLAIAILAVPIAIGIAATATGIQRGGATSSARAPAGLHEPAPIPPAATATATAEPPPSATAALPEASAAPPPTATASAKAAPRGARRTVTRVNSAGF
jgi:serine/threonine-protein kinase